MTVGRLAQLIATVERSYVRMACTGLSMLGVVSVPVELGGDLGQLDLSSINCDVLEATGSARGTRSSGTVAVITCPAEATDACDAVKCTRCCRAARKNLGAAYRTTATSTVASSTTQGRSGHRIYNQGL